MWVDQEGQGTSEFDVETFPVRLYPCEQGRQKES